MTLEVAKVLAGGLVDAAWMIGFCWVVTTVLKAFLGDGRGER
jgi:uncharacterized protein (DUF697 family)